MIDFRLGGVDVLRHLAIGLQHTPAKGNHLTAERMHGKHHASPETVTQLPVVIAPVAESRLLQKLLFESLTLGLLGQSIALIEAVTQLELADDVIAKTALAEISQADALPVNVVVKEVLEITVGKVVHHKHTFAVVLYLLLFSAQLALLHLDVILVGQPLQRFVVVELLMLHDEVHHISSLSAGETFA